MGRLSLVQLPDFRLGPLSVSPSACRIYFGGQEVQVEAQTMSVLVTLAEAKGATASREQLIEACWGERVVSDEAVARTIAKIRLLARGADPAPFTLETIPKVGYRLLAAPPQTESPTAESRADERSAALPLRRSGNQLGWTPVAAAAAGIAALALWAAFAKGPMSSLAHATAAPAVFGMSSADVSDALWTLNEQRLRDDLLRGWNANWSLDSEGNAALHTLLLVCERNRTHDQAALARLAEILVMSGADPTAPNKWGDTPLTIANAPRYCGPDHPVVAFLRRAAANKSAKS